MNKLQVFSPVAVAGMLIPAAAFLLGIVFDIGFGFNISYQDNCKGSLYAIAISVIGAYNVSIIAIAASAFVQITISFFLHKFLALVLIFINLFIFYILANASLQDSLPFMAEAAPVSCGGSLFPLYLVFLMLLISISSYLSFGFMNFTLRALMVIRRSSFE